MKPPPPQDNIPSKPSWANLAGKSGSESKPKPSLPDLSKLTSKPALDGETIPVAWTPKLVDRAPNPVEVAPKLVEVAPKLVEVAPKPVEVAPNPVGSAPKPLEAAPKSYNAVTKPVEATPEPAAVESEKAEADPVPSILSTKPTLENASTDASEPSPTNEPSKPTEERIDKSDICSSLPSKKLIPLNPAAPPFKFEPVKVYEKPELSTTLNPAAPPFTFKPTREKEFLEPSVAESPVVNKVSECNGNLDTLDANENVEGSKLVSTPTPISSPPVDAPAVETPYKPSVTDASKTTPVSTPADENVPLTSPVSSKPVDPETRHYGRDALLQLQQHPLSLVKPERLPALDIVLDTPLRSSSSAPQLGDAPQFHQFARTLPTKRDSVRKPSKIISISREPVKLHKSENAWMCRELSLKAVTKDAKSDENFRLILLERCRKEFLADYISEEQRKKYEDDLTNASSEDDKKKINIDFETLELKMRRRSLGNIRFISELYNLKMLPGKIMHQIIQKLLEAVDEESLESLCRLFTTSGSNIAQEIAQIPLEKRHLYDFDEYFNKIETIVGNKKISSRVRFLLQDVVDLRKNNWVSRRVDSGPKTIQQVRKEAKLEELRIQLADQNLCSPVARRSEDRNRRRTEIRPPRAQVDEGWSNVPVKAQRASDVMDPERLRNIKKVVTSSIKLGPDSGGRGFSSWAGGSSGLQTPVVQSANRYQMLEDSESMPPPQVQYSGRASEPIRTSYERSLSRGRSQYGKPSSQVSSRTNSVDRR